MNQLENKTALVTGGPTGIGLAAAHRFVAEGAHVFVTGRRQAELDRAAEAVRSRAAAQPWCRGREGDHGTRRSEDRSGRTRGAGARS